MTVVNLCDQFAALALSIRTARVAASSGSPPEEIDAALDRVNKNMQALAVAEKEAREAGNAVSFGVMPTASQEEDADATNRQVAIHQMMAGLSRSRS